MAKSDKGGRFKVYELSMLTDVRLGMHTVHTYYSDGTMETTYEPRSPALVLKPIFDQWCQ